MPTHSDIIRELTVEIVSAYVGHNHVLRGELPDIMATLFVTFGARGQAAALAPPEPISCPRCRCASR